MRTCYCRRCCRPVPARGGTTSARLALVAVVLVAGGPLAMMPLLGMGMIFLLPLLMVLGLGIGPAAAAAFPPLQCTACGAVVDRLPLPQPAYAGLTSAVTTQRQD